MDEKTELEIFETLNKTFGESNQETVQLWKFFSLIIIFRGLFLFTVPNVPYLNIKDWTFRCAKPSLKSSTETKGTWATRFLFASESYRPNVFLDVFKRWWVHGFWTMLFSSRNRISAALNRDHIRTACLSVYHSLSLWFLLKTQSN